MGYYCAPCNANFASWLGLKEHYVQSSHHAYCQYCDEHFHAHQDLEEHMEDRHFYCSRCRKVFQNDYGLQEHMRQSQAHNYCVPCRRDFNSPANLRAHLNSSIHVSKDVKCPGYGCPLSFVSRAALASHLESGTCSSGANRVQVNRMITQYDTSNIITDPSRMLTNGTQNVQYSASPAAWNGSGYECYLCHKEYRTLPALNQHLASPRHEDKIYICRLSTCNSRFQTLSGLMQHIESERCGVSKFGAVQQGMDALFGKMNRLTYY